MDNKFQRIERLPPYVFNVIADLRQQARRKGKDIIDLAMGNPDQPTPPHIVKKMIETVKRGDTHRYSQSRGIPRLRLAMANWYSDRYRVELNAESEIIVTIGSKEGLAHLALATLGPGDAVLAPNPSYPIHPYGFVIAGADIRHVPLWPGVDFFSELEKAIHSCWPRPKMLILNFPANPTTMCVDLDFFSRIISLAKKNGIWVVHDLAYADLCFDDYKAPSILQVPDACEVAVEFFSLSKSYNMPGWRVGFASGNQELIAALARIKSYLDYGTFTPIQVAAIAALEGDQTCVYDINQVYKNRRDLLCNGLIELGWNVDIPKATMFVWAKIPKKFIQMKSLKFAKFLLNEAQIAVSPGIGFGEYGDEYIRIALIENEQRLRQALRNLKRLFRSSYNPPI